mgnify:FL=1
MKEPIYETIYQDLLKKIEGHVYGEGAKLPTEKELCATFGASKAPVRQALEKLSMEGFIDRRAGKGTFVKGLKKWPHVELSGFGQEFSQKAAYLTCHTLSVQEKHCPTGLANLLEVPVGTGMVSVRRLRFYKERPIYYLQHYIIGVAGEFIRSKENFSSMLALYDELHIPIQRTKDEIQAVGAPPEIAALLQIPYGTPLMLVNRRTYREDGSLLEYVSFYILTENWKYRAEYDNRLMYE